jgi:hypothetical protein
MSQYTPSATVIKIKSNFKILFIFFDPTVALLGIYSLNLIRDVNEMCLIGVYIEILFLEFGK